jgi:hypothetical protein
LVVPPFIVIAAGVGFFVFIVPILIWPRGGVFGVAAVVVVVVFHAVTSRFKV